MRPVFPAEGDVGVADGDDASVTYHAAPDVGSEVFNGVGSAAEGLHVDGPRFAPHGGIALPAVLLHQIATALGRLTKFQEQHVWTVN